MSSCHIHMFDQISKGWASTFHGLSVGWGVNRLADRRIWPKKATDSRISPKNWTDSRILQKRWITDRSWKRPRISDFECFNVRIADPKLARLANFSLCSERVGASRLHVDTKHSWVTLDAIDGVVQSCTRWARSEFCTNYGCAAGLAKNRTCRFLLWRVSCHLAVVGELAYLDEPESYTGWGLDPWQVQPNRPGRGVEARQSATRFWSSRLGVVTGPITH